MPKVHKSETVAPVKPHTQTPEHSHCKRETTPLEAMAEVPKSYCKHNAPTPEAMPEVPEFAASVKSHTKMTEAMHYTVYLSSIRFVRLICTFVEINI
jgi:hypothetical protein